MITFLRGIYLIFVFIFLSLSLAFAQTITVENVVTGQPDIQVTNSSFDVRKNLLLDVENSSGIKVFVWQEFDAGSTVNKNVRCAVYNADMTLITSFIVNKTTAGDQYGPVVRVNQQDNSFVVGWVSWIDNTNPSDPNKYDIYAKKIRFNTISSDALANDLLINTNYTTGRQYAVSLTYEYTFNELLVGWIDQDGQDRLPTVVANDNGSYARRVSNAGTALSLITGANQFQIITSATVGHQSLNALEVSPVTGELYTFSFSYNFPGGNSCDMIFRKFTRGTDGNYVAGIESIVNTYLPGIQYAGSLLVNSITGDYVVGWTSDTQDGSGYGTYMKVYDKYNSLLKAETRINQVAYGNQIGPKAIWNEASNHLVFYYWYSASGAADIRYQIFNGSSSYSYAGSEILSISKNLVDQFAGQFSLRYGQVSHRIFLTYDEFSGSNTRGWFRQFTFSSGITNPIADLDRNYVQTQTLLKSGIKTSDLISDLDESSVNTVRSYVDGLGRPSQKVFFKGSPLKKDLVEFTVYDQYGREPKKYLSYTAGTDNGGYKGNAVTDQAAFYNASADRVTDDSNPFSINNFEASFLDRVTKVYPEGISWQSGADHSLRSSWRTNTINEVKKWLYSYTTETADGSTYYPAGELYVTEITNEDGNKTCQYKDKLDRLILIKQENITNNEFLETYYIYDDLGNLRFVIPPMRSGITSVSYTSQDAIQYFFYYRYDERQRMVSKKIPGMDSIAIVYDKYDRVVLTQDGNQRTNNQWSYIKYDVSNRNIMTGIYTHPVFLLRKDMQAIVDGYTTNLNENRQSYTANGYSNNVWPTANCDILTVNYYDDYDFDYNGMADYSYIPQGLQNEAPVSAFTRGLQTGAKEKILGNSSDWLKSVMFYDKNKRPLQTQKNNHRNLSVLSDIVTTVYDFTGKIILNKESYNPGSNPITITVKQTYDHAYRPTITRHQVNGNPEIILSENKYNELGQLVEKNLHSENNGSSYLQSLDYTYNIRGWQNNINNSSLSNDGFLNNDVNDLFGLELYYENSGGIGNAASYSGNVSGTIWKSSSSYSPNLKAYKYSYDGAGRILEGKYAEKPSAAWLFAGKQEERNITYDKNGNILTLLRTDASAATLDNLSYQYSGNRLSSVGTTNYVYDANGNMTSDGANAYSYNYLNLLTSATINTTGLTYTYSALGKKLRWARTIPVPIQPTADYIGPLIYKNDILQQFSTSEGRVEYNNSIFSYIYDIRDHLGGLRISFGKNSSGVAQIVQENHYYPFGLSQYTYIYSTSSKYLYNNKELQDETGLGPWYDYGARMYDARLCRWNGVDPMAEKYYAFSPYNYGLNNPLRMIDPDGMGVDDIIIKGINNSSLTVKTDLVNLSVDASSLDVDFGGNHVLEGADVVHAALDVAGIFDPTGAADLANATMYTSEGKYFDAAISTAGVAFLIGDLAKSGRIAKQFDKLLNAIGFGKNVSNSGRPILNAVNTGQRTGSAAYKSLDVDDAQHFFSNIIDNYASQATKFGLKGGDGVTRDFYQISGSLRGQSGVFEWIVDSANITHRRFIPGGVVNGIPNQIVK